MSGRCRIARWITTVLSALKEEATAGRSSPASSRAHRTMAPGWAPSSRRFTASTSTGRTVGMSVGAPEDGYPRRAEHEGV
jgi:hypothetical protein